MNRRLVRDGFEYHMEVEAIGGEEYEYQMLLVNKIDYILPVNVTNVNEKRRLIYSASGYRMLENNLEKTMINGEQMLCIMESVLEGIDGIKQHLLTPDSLVLKPDSIFVDGDFSRIGLIYVPGYERDIILQLRELMECLIGKIDQTDIKSVMLSWRLYVLLKEEHISIKEIRKTLGSYKEKKDIPEETFQITKEKSKSLWEEKIEKRDRKDGGRKLPISIPLVVCCLCMILLVISEIALLYLIYAGGILEWKRNLFLLNSTLLILCLMAAVSIWKKDKVRAVLRSLQEKANEKQIFP